MGKARFFIRLGVTLIALVLVVCLARVWFGGGRTHIIPWQDAAKHYGEYATVEGTIVAAYNSKKVCFLNFHPDHKRYFTAVIFARDFSRFPDNPENYYQGKKVRVSGYIKEYKGKPEIILNDPSQIEILD